MKWQFFLLTGILIAAVLVAACTEEGTSGPEPEAIRVLQPGQILYSIGDVTGDGVPGGTIISITFTVGLVPGEKPVNMENISIVYADAIRTETLNPVKIYRGDPTVGEWGIVNVINEIGSSNNRLEDKEQFVIRINPNAPLVPRQFISIVVKPPSGTPLTIRRISPPSIIKENNILAEI